MSTILPAGPEDTRYFTTFRLDPAELDRPVIDSRLRRSKMALPLSRALIDAGYVVEDYRMLLPGISVVAREAADGKLDVTATIPRPARVPDGELNPETTMWVEYVGGVDDGYVEKLDAGTVVPPTLGIALNGSVYARYGYDLVEGRWLYRRQRPDPEADVVWEEAGEDPEDGS